MAFAKDGTLVKHDYGFRRNPDHDDDDFSQYGLQDFDGELDLHYRFDPKGQLKLVDITVPPRE